MTAHDHPSIPDLVGGFAFTEADFKSIARRAQEWFGLNLTASKKHLVYGRLTKRLRTLGLTDFQSYLQLLGEDESNPERQEFLTSLTTNMTHFFREEHHFKLMRERIFPPLIAAARKGERVRIWSAGCSSGQEPYSVALTLLKDFPQANKFDIKILATDIDPGIVNDARQATYRLDELTGIPMDLRKSPHWIGRQDAGRFRMGPEVLSLVSFAELNLIREWPMRGQFDLIVCRNVAIYFNMETQSKIWERFQERMTDGGYLIIGHSERLSGPAMSKFRSVGITAYINSAVATGTTGPDPTRSTPKGEQS